jgi:UDP-N-acetylglucosamine--N-acetylmuramyl-(pentapeptide) pyrophosphoryl-undecaprenol N-acetylglucosamine transferase
MVNRKLARFADLVLLSYEDSMKNISARVQAVTVGNPLRKMPSPDRTAGAKFFGLDPGDPIVLVWGGSRGAHSLNVSGVGAAKMLMEERNTQFVFLTGEDDYEDVAGSFGSSGGRVYVSAYLSEMFHAYSAADVAVARAGASSVFELSAFGVPTIFVPYPYAADDHQRLNVEQLRRSGYAVVLADKELSAELLTGEIKKLLDDPDRRKEMTRGMLDWARPDAAGQAAARIIALANKAA